MGRCRVVENCPCLEPTLVALCFFLILKNSINRPPNKLWCGFDLNESHAMNKGEKRVSDDVADKFSTLVTWTLLFYFGVLRTNLRIPTHSTTYDDYYYSPRLELT